MSPVRIAVTCGEPTGVGPEVALGALSSMELEGAEIILAGPRGVWEKAARVLGTDFGNFRIVEPEGIPFSDYEFGKMSAGTAKMATFSLEKAVSLALSGEIDALVTAPLSKEGLKLSGRDFPGHTELLGAACGVESPTMLFAGGPLFVSLVTTHLPLKGVAGEITEESILVTVRNTFDFLSKDLGIGSPRIAVCGLNPHAGENGILGDEEINVIGPAVERAKREGTLVQGPFPADALFYRAAKGEFDAVVAMYHDQGLAPFKLIHFHDGVNVTLGLSIVRTSPDHGTAPGIAGKGIADPSSMREAIRLAVRMAISRRKRKAS